MKLKALLVDDEVPILNNLKTVLPWESMQFEVVGLARNGAEALEYVSEHRPDLILCDIRMPIMDGLTFLDELAKTGHECEVLMLTGYQEFEYARKAIQHGVKDYILKPIDYEALQEAVSKVGEAIRASRREMMMMEKKWGRVAHLAYEKILFDVIMGFSTEGVRHLLSDDERNPDDLTYTVLLADTDDYSQKSLQWTDKERKLWNFAVGNVLQDALMPFSIGYLSLQTREGEWCILIEHQKRDYVDRPEEVQVWLEALQSAVRDNVKLSLSVVAFPGTVEFGELSQVYKKLQRVLLQHNGTGPIVSITEEALATHDSEQSLWQSMDAIITGIRQMDRGRTKEALELLQRSLLTDSEHALAKAEKFLHYLIIHLIRELREMDIVSSDDESMLWKKLQHSVGLKDVLETITQLVDNAVEATSSKKSSDMLMISAKEYIHRNLSSDLGIDELADYLGISCSYFSLLFKTHFGETFVEYLTKQRMEQAKSLLAMTDKTITKIGAMVGYAERRYFTKVFHKYAGMSPSEYRESKAASASGGSDGDDRD